MTTRKVATAGALWLFASVSPAQAWQTEQVLERVHVFSPTSVLDMAFDDADRAADFSLLIDDPRASFSACTLTANGGLWCLDGKKVLNWPDATEAAEVTEVLSCEDPALGLDAKKPDTCTGLTVDRAGAIWLAGKNRGKTHSLIKVVRKVDGLCPTDRFYTALTLSPGLCAAELASGRPLLVDINAIDGEVAERLDADCVGCPISGKGTLGLEERKTAVFFPEDGAPVEIASGKTAWSLAGNEQLLGIGLLQMPDGAGGFSSHILVTTSNARILAAETDGTPDVREVFDIAAMRRPTSRLCAAEAPSWGLRASSKSGTVFVTDRNYCETIALEPVTDGHGGLLALANVQQGGGDLTLSTSDARGSFPPLGPTVADGIAIDLADCAESCVLVNDAGGNPAAILSNVVLAGEENGLVLFQIRNIPDCRYIPETCVAALENVASAADLHAAGILLDLPGGGGHPAAQLLNATPLLPASVLDLFPAGLPDLWIPRQYRGQQANGFVFDAFFGLTDATFAGTSDLEVFVASLTGRGELGCPTVTPPTNTPVETLLFYDVAVKVSETVVSIDRDFIPGARDHEATLVNVGCGSSRTSLERWSLLPLNMEFTPDTFDFGTSAIVDNDPRVFLELLVSLFDDLRVGIAELACIAVDGQATAPLSAGACGTLDSQWLNTKDKLDKCIAATLEPKTSLRSQNCQAFVSQFGNLASTASSLRAAGEDPANRIGEIGVRLAVIRNVYDNLFFPSIPDEGFQGL